MTRQRDYWWGPKTMHASGTFEVKLAPEPGDDQAPGVGRMSIDKQFRGDLEAVSRGQMLSAVTSVKGSAGYVAIEQVTGNLHGRSGAFVLQHRDRKSTRLNSSHRCISYAVFCLKKKETHQADIVCCCIETIKQRLAARLRLRSRGLRRSPLKPVWNRICFFFLMIGRPPKPTLFPYPTLFRSMPRKRILFLAEGATMAHFVRPLVLADSLDATQYETHFYAPLRFLNYLSHKPFKVGELRTMPGEQFLANIGKGVPPFPAHVVRDNVKQDCELIRSIRPDLIVGDMRPSLPISARLEGARCAVMMNAYWSPYAKRRSIIPSIPLTRVVPPRLLGPLYRLTEPLAFGIHVGQMNRVRKEFGIPALPGDLRVMYTEADYVLYPDVPEFVPTANLPKHHYYVGPCPWALPMAKPDWWKRMVEDPKPKVFVALGSSGAVRAMPALMRALSKLSAAVVLATSSREMPATAAGMYVADLLPLTETAAQCSVVVSHGGSTGVYPAIAGGTPVLGIPSNADQQLSAAVLAESGAGLAVRVEEAGEKRLLGALERLLSEPPFRLAAKRWAAVFDRYESGALFRKFVDEALSAAPRGA